MCGVRLDLFLFVFVFVSVSVLSTTFLSVNNSSDASVMCLKLLPLYIVDKEQIERTKKCWQGDKSHEHLTLELVHVSSSRYSRSLLTWHMRDRSNALKTTNTSESTKCEASYRTQPGALDQPVHQRQRGNYPGLVNTHTPIYKTHTHTHSDKHRHRSNESQLWMVAWYSKTTINVERRQDMLTY